MQILDGKSLSAKLKKNLKKDVEAFSTQYNRKPHLAVILVGSDPASQIYTQKKAEQAKKAGMESSTHTFDDGVDPKLLEKKCSELNQDSTVDGILIQRPLPPQFNEEEVMYWVDPKKDVDAFHPELIGRLSRNLKSLTPCTPTGIMALLKEYQIELSGKLACVIGRSSLVGDPMTTLLKHQNATTIQCHSQTQDLNSLTRLADVLVVASGQKKMIQASHVKKGAVVIDVGIHRNDDGTLCGDVDFDSVKEKVSAITPVPGGVGPLTITFLLSNTLKAAKARLEN